MDCETCRQLRAEVERVERTHAEKLGELRAQAHWVHQDEYRRLLTAEHDAEASMDSARMELELHQRTHEVQ
jgi:hypothetical protein